MNDGPASGPTSAQMQSCNNALSISHLQPRHPQAKGSVYRFAQHPEKHTVRPQAALTKLDRVDREAAGAQDLTAMKLQEAVSKINESVPPERLLTYSRLWQFETWLRAMVYVELRACYGDSWESRLSGSHQRPFEGDRRLSHMPTRESMPTSYLQLSDLTNTISSNWRLFEPYLPPQEIWDAKLLEVKQIRHRVAHFRLGHEYDLDRVDQLLKDVDQGFWRFCTSYNDAHPILPPSDDAVISMFLDLDPFPWSEGGDGRWARVGIADPSLTVSVHIEVLRRPWLDSGSGAGISGREGELYEVTLHARDRRRFESSRFISATEPVHRRICHILLDVLESNVRVSVPAILGPSDVIQIIDVLVSAARTSLAPGRQLTDAEDGPGSLQHQANLVEYAVSQWPEYILGPSNPLTFLCPDNPCSFFGVSD